MTHHERVAELEQIDAILDGHPEIVELVHADLVRGVKNPEKGPRTLAAETVLRILIIKQTNDYTYKDLEFHLGATAIFRWFCRLDCVQLPKRATMQRDIQKIRPETLEEVNRIIVRHALENGVESGRKVRTDCTCVETMIHAPTDSSLLEDCVRVLTRSLAESRKVFPQITYCDHTRRAKRRAKGIQYSRGKERRTELYRDLLIAAKKTLGYAQRAVETLTTLAQDGAELLASELRRYIGLTEKVMAQTRRRVIEGESVPVEDKIVSIFEPHTDIIVKGGRDKVYGHKICLTAGASGMILDGKILEGNPADSTLTVEMMERVRDACGKIPRQATFDGAFASRGNVKDVKALGVRDVVFSKSRGIRIEDMARSEWVYKRLRNFRAGIEATISFLKRSFLLRRCTWRGETSFKSYVWSSILSANLLIVARSALR